MARTEARCELVDGFYQNSQEPIHDIRFETVVDVFSINNAQTLIFELEGQELKFYRSEMKVNKQTQMTYLLRKGDVVIRAARLALDRTPREVSQTKEFYGNMIISSEISSYKDITEKRLPLQNLVYNFYCRF